MQGARRLAEPHCLGEGSGLGSQPGGRRWIDHQGWESDRTILFIKLGPCSRETMASKDVHILVPEPVTVSLRGQGGTEVAGGIAVANQLT